MAKSSGVIDPGSILLSRKDRLAARGRCNEVIFSVLVFFLVITTAVSPALSEHPAIVTPLSLVWEDGVDTNSIFSASQFPLSPERSGKWYRWRASATTPLLVYDPDFNGIIHSASQLFGNFTFGKRWGNGYEALQALDKGKDGKLELSELDDIALWFDENQDGISQAGEIRSLSQYGVTVIYTTPDNTDSDTGDISARTGYVRYINGEKFVRPSIDWVSEEYGSREEVLARKNKRKENPEKISAVPNPGYINAGYADAQPDSAGAAGSQPPKDPGSGNSLSGSWIWKTEMEKSHPTPAAGLFTIVDESDGLRGHSFIEVPLHSSPGGSGSAVVKYELSGFKTAGKDGTISVSFRLTDAGGVQTLSKGELSADGSVLTGTSTLQVASGDGSENLNYTWSAKRAD